VAATGGAVTRSSASPRMSSESRHRLLPCAAAESRGMMLCCTHLRLGDQQLLHSSCAISLTANVLPVHHITG
jgi:hypothetical protein